MLKQLLAIGIVFLSAPFPVVGEIPPTTLQVFPPMNQIYHPISTTNPEAQQSFDKGLSYIFAYNHNIAFREFEKASKLDPKLAMAYWGMALALGQNVNEDVTPENEVKCYAYVQQALKLANNTSPEERAYIEALRVRYTNDPKADLIPLRGLYRDAMKKVMQTYSEDLDAATLYAESILNLNPWKWWTPDGKPLEGTYEAIDVLESVLDRNPEHIGANHFYIHCWEESPYPERALMSAYRLTTLLPESGHLLHMPCHIFLLVGDYETALKTNLNAIAQDRDYIKRVGMAAGSYPLHYLSHNLAILVRIYTLLVDYDNAIKVATELTQFVQPYVDTMPHLAFAAKPTIDVYLYFNKWKELLSYTLSSKTPSMEAYWHFSRAVAYASLGDVKSATKEKELMQQLRKQIPASEEYAQNPFSKVMDIAALMVDASIAKGQKRDGDYIRYLNQAITLQDALDYDEPPAWYMPIRQVLGFAYLDQKNYSAAEETFKKSLQKLRRNGRSLHGLSLALTGQNRSVDAYWVEREMTAALKNASPTKSE